MDRARGVGHDGLLVDAVVYDRMRRLFLSGGTASAVERERITRRFCFVPLSHPDS